MYVSAFGQCSVSLATLILFLKAALQLGAHDFVYTGWPVSLQIPLVRLLTLGLGLQDGATTPAFDVGAEDCMQVLTSAQQELYHPSHPSSPSSFCIAHAST